VVRAIGKGAQARVYLAWDANLEYWRAVKVLAAQYLKDDAVRARFEGEATMMARLGHHHVMTVVDVDPDGAMPYMVMDLARGGSVVDWMKRHGKMPPRMAVGVAIGCCHALEYTHAQGIVHRDVKPHNVLIHEDGRTLLTDFGIARADDAVQLTANGAAMGTFAFMPPEQRADAHSVTERADVYALGATLYTMLTARTSTELFLADTKDKMLDGVPDALRPVVLTACKYEPELRYATITAMRAALEAALSELPEDPPSAPLYEERIPLPPAVPMFLEPDSGAEELAAALAPPEDLATVLYQDPGGRGRTDPGLNRGKTDPGLNRGKTDPGTGRGKTDPGLKTRADGLAAAIPYQMPDLRRSPRSIPPPADVPLGDDVPDYVDAAAAAAAEASRKVDRTPAPAPPPKPAPKPPEAPTPATPPEPEPGLPWRGIVAAAVVIAALMLVMGGVAGMSIRAKTTAAGARDQARQALVQEVGQSQAIVEVLGQLGADAPELQTSWFAYKDAGPTERAALAEEFAVTALREADRVGPRARGEAQVVELRRRLREAEEAEARYDAARSSLLGKLTGSLGTR
jgi:serine/threonine protein kinase